MRSKAFLEVDLNLLAQNLNLIKKQYPKTHILMMVKANAYGHGDKAIVEACIKQGVQDFGLATMQEALELRKSFPSDDIHFYAFSETELVDINRWKKNYLDKNIYPVIENNNELHTVLSDPELRQLKIVLKFNIGMNRFGINQNDLEETISLLKKYKRNIYHLLGHLPCANELKKLDKTKHQISYLQEIKNKIIAENININHASVCNSAAIERGLAQSGDFDFIRPGLLAYGPMGTKDNPMGWKGSMISSLKAIPLKSFPITKGEEFGYGATLAPESGIVAILPLGYADGVTQNYSAIEFSWGSLKGKMIGYSNMDICFVLFEKLPNDHDGLPVIVWGHNPHAFAHSTKKMKINQYQRLCQISSRVPRLYKMS